ncbi:polynucleotide kinase-phosphatase [Nocardioides lianchengensis]|uniref:Polynucleotide kinase-phosphatase n=1 Tax=Nocardioides lianchengensis TaxID=1045774 RepID=A0A1G6RLU8_9ACTN|nr:polynucleotide kinase-phosphatase [Nocardioides lianchengensis]NYG10188.1 polynucleotide kinase-phosphatase [Nocardioides lianchengensis]SDD05609.1 polynucleotide kinase-phosphatase [Nocardioides lianchengensis]
MPELRIPERGLVILVGVSGSGKSTFAARHFAPTQVISSDFCRGLVADDENDQDATRDAFDVLHYIVGTRLRRGLLTVVDATNVQDRARASLIEVAREHDVLVDAIVLDVPESVAQERNRLRPDRDFGRQVVARQHRDLRKGLSRMGKRIRRVHVLQGTDEIDAATVVTERPWNDRRDLTGPFDLVGDVHGCASELRTLLGELGWDLEYDDRGRAVGAAHPEGRTAVFVGDLVDRGPDTPGVLRLVMGMVAAGSALCVSGNHEAKLVRALKGSDVRRTHGLAESLDQLEGESAEFRAAALTFMDGLISHYVLDEGRLVVAHAGLKESYHGRTSGRVRSFALYGDTTGETDEFGLPVRYPWAQEYRGRAMVVYGHTPVPETEWVNNTICLDTGVVFGGALTALRYPGKEVVSVPAEQQWFEPVRPLAPPVPERAPGTLRLEDVLTPGAPTWLSTRTGKVKVPEENAAAALEVMSRFAVDPRWLVHLPATMAPAPASREDGYLEHPEQAFDAYARAGVESVVCEEKHMGSRAIVVLARDEASAERRFGVADGSTGTVHTRTGRAFFDPTLTGRRVDGLRASCAPLFEQLATDWLVLDAELLPWSAKAEGLIREQYAAVGTAAHHALPAVQRVLDAAAGRGLEVAGLADRAARRTAGADAFRDAYAAYVRPTDGLDGVTLAPFQVLAAEGRNLAASEPHPWHLAQLGVLAGPLLTPTRHRIVDLASPDSRAAATRWWLDLTAAGGEGMVVKPAHLVDRAGKVQPGLKVRGRDYLRLVYGPDYLDSLDLLRGRDTGRKGGLAIREHRLGLESLDLLVEGEPLWRVHQAVFAVLALESEPVDPRL